MAELTIAGAGMAGLAAAARARELGLSVRLLEKGDRVGGSMRLSSGAIWRYRTFGDFTSECPHGDRALQRLVFERLDEGLAWLESLGLEPGAREWGNERVSGARFVPAELIEALLRAAAVEPELGARLEPLEHDHELLLATGGFHASPELIGDGKGSGPFLLRGNPWSSGDGLRAAVTRGGVRSAGLGEFYCRALPAPPALVPEDEYAPASMLFGRWAVILDDDGALVPGDESDWSEVRLAQRIARRPSGRAWYVVDARTLAREVLGRSVGSMIERARELGGDVRSAEKLASLGIGAVPTSDLLAEPPFTAVRIAIGITHTMGGLKIDNRARVLNGDGDSVDGLLAAGADAGGISTGGYASGLAQALVLGLTAAETAATR